MIFGRLDERSDMPGARASSQPHAVNDLPRHVENGGRHHENGGARHAESIPAAERMPRPVVPDPSREHE
jgi:hypothetical protein